jgi:xanthine dehydrogenase accessory factor
MLAWSRLWAHGEPATLLHDVALAMGTVGVVAHAVHSGSGAEQPVVDSEATSHRVQPLQVIATSLLRTVAETQRASVTAITHGESMVRLFADPLLPPVALHVIGAGRGAEAFARIAASIGWQVTIVDHRPALLESLVLPAGVTCRHARPEQASELVADAFSAVALMTHIFEIDRAWLEALLPRHHGYVGVLGSRQRAERLLGAIDVDTRSPLHAPIGLDIGGESPESIALATIAEIHAVMHARPGGPLRERRSPIHDRTPVPAINPDAIRVASTACQLPE